MDAAATFPGWVMLERFVFRRDDEESFPDGITASGITSLDAGFRIAFSLAKPPLVSRLYAQMPTFPPPTEQVPLTVLASHRHLFLLRVGMETPALELLQDFFIYDACATDNRSRLRVLPICTEPIMDYTRRDGRLPRRRCLPGQENKRRLLAVRSMGLVSRGEHSEEFAVAELKLFKPSHSKVYADICLLRSCTSPHAGPELRLGGKWNSMRRPIKLLDQKPDDPWQLNLWQTDDVIPFDDRLCWVDYFRGVLFCDVFREPTPTVSFLRFPLEEFPDTHIRTKTCSWYYRCVTAVHQDRALMFVSVDRNDGVGYGALKPGAAFTITCHTLNINSKVWDLTYKLTSNDLWCANPSLPHGILMFPQVDMCMPHVVHFLFIEFGYVLKKMWLVTIDMITKTVTSFYPYINGEEDSGTKDFDLTEEKSSSPMSFLPCEFSRFLHISRKRKDME